MSKYTTDKPSIPWEIQSLSIEELRKLREDTIRLARLSGTCEFAIGSLTEKITELHKVAKKMKASEGSAQDFLWDVEKTLSNLEILREVFTDNYKEDGFKPDTSL